MAQADFRNCCAFMRRFYLLVCHGCIVEACPACNATGRHLGSGLVCSVCRGARKVVRPPEFDVSRN